MIMELVFWISALGVVYPYAGYPLLLWLLNRLVGRRDVAPAASLPSVTMIIPVHNEATRLDRKLVNTAALRYPAEQLQVLFVSDGSTDDTVARLRQHSASPLEVVELPVRGGKAAALNAGVSAARHELLVFSDASIELEADALRHIVRRFADPRIGCVSGEDRIGESGGEAWYGRYELMLRRLESAVGSIVGASGSFYAQRTALCQPFTEGMAPDFLSVLRTVEQGYRAVTEPTAVGAMTSVKNHRNEFERKVRTAIRGLTTLFAHTHLLNPFRFGSFAFALWSHKVLRWMAPVFLLGAFVSAALLLGRPFYTVAFGLQAVLYLCAFAAHAGWSPARQSFAGKVALYFTMVNLAIAAAWVQYGRGVRQELWTPTAR